MGSASMDADPQLREPLEVASIGMPVLNKSLVLIQVVLIEARSPSAFVEGMKKTKLASLLGYSI